MMDMKQKHLLILILLVLLDQLTKVLIATNLKLFESIDIIHGFFCITYVQNTGAAWSMMEGNMIFFYLISVVALFIMWQYYHSDESDMLGKWSMVLMIGGTLGNFIDRLRLQYVVDFFDFMIFGYDFPVFNLADVFLCLGVGVFVLSFVLEGVKKHEAK